MTSVIPICSNDSAAVEVVARSYDDISRGNSRHASLLIRIDYICVGNDGQQVRDNRQRDLYNVTRQHHCTSFIGTVLC